MFTKVGIRLAVLFLLLILGLGGAWLWWIDAMSAASPSQNTQKNFKVSTGEGVRAIANRLKNDGLIKDQIGFFIAVKIRGYESKIQAGDFRLSPSMDVNTILNELSHGISDVWLTTLEGWRKEEIALKVAQDLAIPETEFIKNAREGYMFPDTYLIPKDASASSVAKIITDNFNKRVTADIRQNIQMHQLTFEQGIILASIVEREGKTQTDRPVIAGILLNRLQKGWPLQTDATIQYALGYQPNEKSWWKKYLSEEDKKIISPYNSYANPGLPPSPICNPGLESIQAVASPAATSYWFYLHDKEGNVHYAEMLAEHEANIAKYLQ